MTHSWSGCWVQAYDNRGAYNGKYDGYGANGQSHGCGVHTCEDGSCNDPVAPQYDIVRFGQRTARPQPRNVYPHGFVFGSSRPASQGVTHPGISLVQARLTSEFSWDPKPVSFPKGLVSYQSTTPRKLSAPPTGEDRYCPLWRLRSGYNRAALSARFCP
ncbi:hypothetical protein LguiB_009649 [Lonicera macranthoides]